MTHVSGEPLDGRKVLLCVSCVNMPLLNPVYTLDFCIVCHQICRLGHDLNPTIAVTPIMSQRHYHFATHYHSPYFFEL